MELDLHSWARPPDAGDESVLARCAGPTLDIGCGPGRMVVALGRRGIPALGIDVTAWAVSHVRADGGLAMERSVFDRMPGEGRWPTGVLLDGNVGIGGSPATLLARVRELLAPYGRVHVEHDPDEERDERITARLTVGSAPVGRDVEWAVAGARAVARAATAAGLVVGESWTYGTRAFTSLARPGRTGEGDR